MDFVSGKFTALKTTQHTAKPSFQSRGSSQSSLKLPTSTTTCCFNNADFYITCSEWVLSGSCLSTARVSSSEPDANVHAMCKEVKQMLLSHLLM